MIKKKLLNLISTLLLSGFIALNTISTPIYAEDFKIGEKFTVSELNLGNKAYIIACEKEDVTGDKTDDSIVLIGTKDSKNSIFSDNLTIVVQDGKTRKYSKSTYDNFCGYNGKLFIGDFSGDKVKDVMVSAFCGGSSGVFEHMISTFKDNKSSVIFSQKNTIGIEIEGKYIDNFKAELNIKNINKKITLDLSSNKDTYIKNQIYNKDGKLSKEITPYLNSYSLLNPIDYNGDGIYELEGYQSMVGTCNTDKISNFKSILKFEDNQWNIKNLEYSTFLIK